MPLKLLLFIYQYMYRSGYLAILNSIAKAKWEQAELTSVNGPSLMFGTNPEILLHFQ